MAEKKIDFEENEKSIPWDGGYVRMNEEVKDGIRKNKDYPQE